MQQLTVSASTQYSLGLGSGSNTSVCEFQTVGMSATCAVIPKARIGGTALTGTTQLVSVPYLKNGVAVTAGTSITSDGIFQVDSTGQEIVLVSTVSSGTATVQWWLLEGGGSSVSSGGGGGGGGAVTIADGADVTLGAIADTAVATDADGTVNAHIRGMVKLMAATVTAPAQVSLWDQTLSTQQAIKAASTAAVAGDPAAVVAISPNNVLKAGDGTSSLTMKAASTAAAAADIAAVVAVSPNNVVKVGDGTTSLVMKAASTAAAAADASAVVALSPNSVGSVGGVTTVIKPTCTVSTSPAYTSGDDAGGKITISSAVRVSAGTGVFQSLELFFKSGTAPTGVFLLFDADPTNATITDNAAFVWSTDQTKLIGMIPVISTDLITVGSQIVARPAFTPFPIKAASGTTLYAAYVLTSTPTFSVSTDMLCVVGILQD